MHDGLPVPRQLVEQIVSSEDKFFSLNPARFLSTKRVFIFHFISNIPGYEWLTRFFPKLAAMLEAALWPV
jgi:hypothetical protein